MCDEGDDVNITLNRLQQFCVNVKRIVLGKSENKTLLKFYSVKVIPVLLNGFKYMTSTKELMRRRSRYSSVYSSDFESQQGLGIFLYTTAPRKALGPTQPPIWWVPGALSLGIKRPGCEAYHSPPSSAEIKNAWSYTFTPQYSFMESC